MTYRIVPYEFKCRKCHKIVKISGKQVWCPASKKWHFLLKKSVCDPCKKETNTKRRKKLKKLLINK